MLRRPSVCSRRAGVTRVRLHRAAYQLVVVAALLFSTMSPMLPRVAEAASRPAASTTSYTVQPGDNLWTIARATLGDGAQWQAIWAANQAQTMHDGRVFAAPDHLWPGWVLTIPRGSPAATPSRAPATSTGTSPAAEQTSTAPSAQHLYTVQSGDSLSLIAAQQLGDATKWTQIWDLNRGHVMNDGSTFDDPDVIQVGWQLALAKAGWIAQTASAAKDVALRAIGFAGSSTGWAIGDDGRILRTADGGATWTAQKSPTSKQLSAMAVRTTAQAWAVGEAGTILETKDSGKTWILHPSGTTQDLFGITAIDAAHLLVVGANGTILRTTDGGQSWSLRTSGTANDLHGVTTVAAPAAPTTASTGTQTFADRSPAPDGVVAVAVGQGGTIVRSTDGGLTWTPVESGSHASLNGVTSVTGATLVAVGQNGTILQSTDGGLTWAPRPSGTTNGLNATAATAGGIAYAVGDAGTLLKSTDGGKTWIPQSSGTTSALYAIVVRPGGAVIVVGGDGTIGSGTPPSSTAPPSPTATPTESPTPPPTPSATSAPTSAPNPPAPPPPATETPTPTSTPTAPAPTATSTPSRTATRTATATATPTMTRTSTATVTPTVTVTPTATNTPIRCTTAPSGLIDWWRGEGNANDTSGTANGTAVGGVTYATGKVGEAFSFDGSTGYVTLPGTYGGGAEMSVVAWYKMAATTGDFQAIVEPTNTSLVHLQLNSFGNVVVYVDNGSEIDLPILPDNSPGVWHLVILSIKSGATTLYLDGTAFGTSAQTFTTITPATTVRIGAGFNAGRGTTGARFFHGAIDEVAFFNRALTAAEVQAIYNAGTSGMCVQ